MTTKLNRMNTERQERQQIPFVTPVIFIQPTACAQYRFMNPSGGQGYCNWLYICINEWKVYINQVDLCENFILLLSVEPLHRTQHTMQRRQQLKPKSIRCTNSTSYSSFSTCPCWRSFLCFTDAMARLTFNVWQAIDTGIDVSRPLL